MKNIKGRDKYIQKNQERVLREFIDEMEIDLFVIPGIREIVMAYFSKTVIDKLEKEMEDNIIFKIDIQKTVKTRAEMAQTLRKIADLIEEGYDSSMADAWKLTKEISEEPEEPDDIFQRIIVDKNSVICEDCGHQMKAVKRPDMGDGTIITIYKCPNCLNTISK
jgi:hypothetical protein